MDAMCAAVHTVNALPEKHDRDRDRDIRTMQVHWDSLSACPFTVTVQFIGNVLYDVASHGGKVVHCSQ